MTKDEMLTRFAELAKSSPGEDEHIEADDLILAYLNDPEISEAYYRIHKWYA